MDAFITLYGLLKTDKKKERFDIILEPLQALTQLSAMAFCPIGSKLTISNNLLYIQPVGWGQGLLRAFNNDKRDDLFYLFNVIVRFNVFYGYFKTNSECEEDGKLFILLIRLSKQGIDNLLLTYANIDQPSLLHTLQMYRTLLDNPELIMKNNNSGNNETTPLTDDDVNSKKSINDVFIHIRKIYTIHERNILFHLLSLMEKHPDQHLTYIEAINATFAPINTQIKKWINDNIVY
jgi:hypothetical protein